MSTITSPARGAPHPGPVVATGELVARTRVGPYHRLRLAVPELAHAALPGQFVSVGIDAPGVLLRRPFAIAGVDATRGLVDLVIAVVGRGSAWLATRPVPTMLDIVGPLGTAFTAPPAPATCLLVGGGYGVAALAWLAGRLDAAGHAVEVISGARSGELLYPADDLEASVTEVTDDGSRGRVGLVTDVLAERLDAGDPTTAVMVYACGPMAMLAACARRCAAHDRACEVAVEEHMGCSVGVCMTCVVPTADGNLRSCVEGPVLDGHRIDWDRLRT